MGLYFYTNLPMLVEAVIKNLEKSGQTGLMLKGYVKAQPAEELEKSANAQQNRRFAHRNSPLAHRNFAKSKMHAHVGTNSCNVLCTSAHARMQRCTQCMTDSHAQWPI